MAFQGFGKNSGPSAPVKLHNPFGSFPNAAAAPSPPPFRPSPPLQPSPSQSAPYRAPSPSLSFQNKHFFPDINPSSRQIHPVLQRAPSPPLDLQNKHSFPDLGPPARQIQSQSIPQRAPSPPLGFQNKRSFPDISSSSRQIHPVPQRAPSPPLDFQSKRSFPDIGPPARQIQRPVSSTSAWGSISKLSSNFPSHPTQGNQPSDLGYIQSSDSGRNFPASHVDVQAPKRVRSPSQPYMDESSGDDPLFDRHYLKRPSLSPSQPSTKSNVHIDDHQWFPQASHVIDNEAASKNPASFPAPKRTRSPSSPSPEPVFQGNSNAAQEENDRELQAKAKRLARFKNELNEPLQSIIGNGNTKAPVKKRDQSEVEKRIFNEEPSDMAGDYPSSNISADYEGVESSTIIIGVCPDMCPESERGERERKGDLDQYERVDGDRNQTSISLAVKKYTRTAAREADLIRPMPILQKTLDYLLHLLDQPYDDTFLGSYNFLWDRMRAIRMDLRMQHIFNLGSITMLEQMIRLHIIAMHELCQYTKGEGFSEGFDAHLNIEQMNKTSVELFQLYDDHRKRGIDVPTEKEFRGYYALLKLDKHPGYKVEPAELSLDLAKMTPEIRQAAEVLFARNVARACRTGNFIAFFRLASKASYLQACLMHAHFGKLRSQALASLHSGLQSNQGIPVSLVAKWLGMEEENIEDLLDYHGFAIKDFEEPYMVKEGSFLNGDSEYPLKRSKLVDLKKSRRIVEDVSCPSVMEPSSAGGVKLIHVNKTFNQKLSPVQLKERESPAPAIHDEMAEYETADSSKKNIQMKAEFKAPVVDKWNGNSNEVGVPSPAPVIFSIDHSSFETPNSRTAHSIFESPKSRDDRISFESPKSSIAPFSLNSQIFTNSHNPSESPKSSTGKFGKPIYDTSFRNSLEKNKQSNPQFSPQIMPTSIELERSPVSPATSTLENQIHQSVFVDGLEAVKYTGMEAEVEPDEVDASHDDEEVAMAKLKLILRIWRRRSMMKKELREQKQLAANAALSSLSLGLPMRQFKDEQHAASDFDIDHVMSERYERHEQSWSRLNVSDVVAAILSEKNQHASCLCWKVIFSSYSDHPEEDKLDPGQWLRSKIIPTISSDDEDLIISSPGLSVWKKWFSDQSSSDLTCCFSVIKQSKFDNNAEAEKGASAVMFLVSESISWGSHKIRLHNLLVSIPSGSRLPLLIIDGSYKNYLDPSVVSKELELNAVDQSKISSFLVIPLLEDQQMKNLDGFFSDKQLRKGLQWLASESPLQPLVCCVKTQELVHTHLNLSLEVLENLNANKVSPDQCVSAFNDALDRSIENVINAANENPISWPSPEIALLEKSSYEYRIAELYLPQIGWSTPAMIEPLLRTLNNCKLPPFPDGTSWLDKGSDFGNDIENQRLQLEDILVAYLTQSTRLMGPPLAQKEASIMLQTCAGLDLHHSTYYIVPKWTMIFRRIFNWRLTSLYSGPSSIAYVLEQNYTEMTTSRCSNKLDTEDGISSPYKFNLPSLDEMVDVSCGPYPDHEKFQLSSTQMISYETEVTEDGMNIGEDDTLGETNSSLLTNGSRLNTSSEIAVSVKATKEADRLSKLLEQCNIVQNMIDKKLSIYFQ